MTLDGVVPAPSYADEDTTGSFRHGGWRSRYFDDVSMSSVVENIGRAGGYLLGAARMRCSPPIGPTRRRSNRRSPGLEQAAEIRRVDDASRATRVADTTLLSGDIAEAVTALKAKHRKDLHVIGSPGLVQSLIGHGLFDELQVMIDPLIVGGGKRLFGDDGALTERVTEVVGMLARGLQTKQVARALGISGEDRRPPHPERVREDRRLDPRRRDPVRDGAWPGRMGRTPDSAAESSAMTSFFAARPGRAERKRRRSHGSVSMTYAYADSDERAAGTGGGIPLPSRRAQARGCHYGLRPDGASC